MAGTRFARLMNPPTGRRTMAAAALIGAAILSGQAIAQGTMRSEPFPAWPDPVINPKMTVDEAKAIVAERTKPQTEWKGPTDGPEGSSGRLHHRLCLAGPSPTHRMCSGAKVSRKPPRRWAGRS